MKATDLISVAANTVVALLFFFFGDRVFKESIHKEWKWKILVIVVAVDIFAFFEALCTFTDICE